MNIVIQDNFKLFKQDYYLFVNGEERGLLPKQKEIYAIDDVKGGDVITIKSKDKYPMVSYTVENPNNVIVITRKRFFMAINIIGLFFIVLWNKIWNLIPDSWAMFVFVFFILFAVIWFVCLIIPLLYPEKSFKVIQQESFVI